MRQRLQSRRLIFAASLLFVLPFSFIGENSTAASQNETVFRYHIPVEPHSLDPSKLTSTDASYFFNNVMRGLYSFSNEEGLIEEGAKDCRFETPLRLVCRLATDSFWSDGKPVVAEDYVRGFQKLISAASKNPSVELLRKVKNAMAVNGGRAKLSELGVTAPKKDRLVIEFEQPDPDFLYKLISSVLMPNRFPEKLKRGELKGLVFNGPYKLSEWVSGRRLKLTPNPYYKRGNPKRPPVEVLFIDEDQTALNLYEKKDLSFLRRLPTTYIPQYRDRPDFLQIPVARFDYIGFGTELKDLPDVREALSHAPDYSELKKVYDALGTPGCTSLPEELLGGEICVRQDLERAKKAWAKVPDEIKKRRFRFAFSKQGGDDIKKGMEWYQAQWKKTLGLQIDLEQTEQGVYLAKLRSETPPIFRKGVGLERPTCLSALETFARGGSENFLKLDDPVFEASIEKLAGLLKPAVDGRFTRFPSPEAQKACREGVQRLLDQHLIIPQGRIHFTILVDPAFKGWRLNEMNQLDLAHLEVVPPKKK